MSLCSLLNYSPSDYSFHKSEFPGALYAALHAMHKKEHCSVHEVKFHCTQQKKRRGLCFLWPLISPNFCCDFLVPLGVQRPNLSSIITMKWSTSTETKLSVHYQRTEYVQNVSNRLQCFFTNYCSLPSYPVINDFAKFQNSVC